MSRSSVRVGSSAPRDARVGAGMVSAWWFVTFAYGPVTMRLHEALPTADRALLTYVAPLAWLVLLVLCALATLRLARRHPDFWPRATPALNAAATVLVAIPIVTVVSAPRAPLAPRPDVPDSTRITPATRPDIYYIVLDGFGSAEVLSNMYEVDIEPFLASLEAQGFYVARRSRANYAHTLQSITSSLGMRYNPPPPAAHRRGPTALLSFTQSIRNNAVMAVLRRHGYAIHAFATGYGNTELRSADHFLSPGRGLSQFQNMLLGLTPAPAILALTAIDDAYALHRRRIEFTLDGLVSLARKPGPRFVFAHLLAPHPPFVFDRDGAPREHALPFKFADGSDFRRRQSRADYIRGYAAQVSYLSRRVEKTVRGILASSAAPPVIIVQGDHGPGSEFHQDRLDKTNLVERMSIFNAMHLPDPQASRLLYPEISPVNTFRLILGHYLGEPLPLLRDRSFFNAYSDPHHYIEVTSRLRNAK